MVDLTKFFGLVLILDGMGFWMLAELAVFEGLASFSVKDGRGLFGEKSIGVQEAGGILVSDQVGAVDTRASDVGNG